MVRSLSNACLGFALLWTTVAMGTGCSNPAQSAVLAQVPGSDRPISSKTPADGEYAIYRVTQFNRLGQPEDAKVIASYHLPRGEPIGFRWITRRADAWHPDAKLQLQAFAGDHVDDLGPISSMLEKYYWANPAGWGHYWTIAPAVGFEQRVTGQN